MQICGHKFEPQKRKLGFLRGHPTANCNVNVKRVRICDILWALYWQTLEHVGGDCFYCFILQSGK